MLPSNLVRKSTQRTWPTHASTQCFSKECAGSHTHTLAFCRCPMGRILHPSWVPQSGFSLPRSPQSAQGHPLIQGLAASSETGQQDASLRGDSDINSGHQHRTRAPEGPQGAPRKQTSASHRERPVPCSGGVECEEKEILLLPHKAILPRAQGVLCKGRSPARL